MSAAPPISTVHTGDPVGATLRAMGNAARQASETWTVREWAARLATKAKPHDYVGQLRQLYRGILDRWRYVREPGEWVTSTGDAVVKYTLGAQYNCSDPLKCVLDAGNRSGWQRGWGDCDDVSALVAAGSLALGMTPYFRAVFPPGGGGGHVSALVRTPDGVLVSVDPVGYPHHPFGWVYSPPGSSVITTDMDGRTVSKGIARGANTMNGCVNFGPNPYQRGMSGQAVLSVGPHCPPGTVCGTRIESPGCPRVRMPAEHVVLLRPGAQGGGRALSMPAALARVFRTGKVLDGAMAWDQDGDMYEYVHDLDAFVPAGFVRESDIGMQPGVGLSGYAAQWTQPLAGMGNIRRRRRARRARIKARRMARRGRVKKRRVRRRRKVARALRKVTRPIARAIRKLTKRALLSPMVQAAAAAALKVFGVPPRVTKQLMSAVGRGVETKLGAQFVRLIRQRKYRDAARLVRSYAQREGAELARSASKAIEQAQMGALESQFVLGYGSGHTYAAAPVVAISGVELGVEDAPPPSNTEEDEQVDDGDVVLPPEAPDMDPVAEFAITDTPTPGAWYRIGTDSKLKGKGFLTHVGRAYGVGSGSQRLALSKMVAAHPANRNQLVEASGNAKKWFPGGVPSFLPKFAADINRAWAGEKGKSPGVVYFPLDAEDAGPPGPPVAPTPQPPPEPAPEPIPPEPTPIEPQPIPPAPVPPAPAPVTPPVQPPVVPPPAPAPVTPPVDPTPPLEPVPPAPQPIQPSGPPKCPAGQAALWNGATNMWECVNIGPPEPAPAPPAPAPAPVAPVAPVEPIPTPPAPAPAPPPVTPPSGLPDDWWIYAAGLAFLFL